jgi:predicted 3-demethylubiquinone-9 3-methyltransferase (glyoxalase superfamily)
MPHREGVELPDAPLIPADRSREEEGRKNGIIQNLWFENCTKEAADHYVSVFPDGKVFGADHYTESGEEVAGHGKGDIVTIEFEPMQTRFVAINAGPEFPFSPSASFMFACGDQEQIDHYW